MCYRVGGAARRPATQTPMGRVDEPRAAPPRERETGRGREKEGEESHEGRTRRAGWLNLKCTPRNQRGSRVGPEWDLCHGCGRRFQQHWRRAERKARAHAGSSSPALRSANELTKVVTVSSDQS